MTDSSSRLLEGAPNFRDLGGYKTADGRVVKRSLAFRSSNLARLTDADFAALRDIPLKTIIDLRAPDEAKLFPSRLPDDLGIAMINHAVNPYALIDGKKYKQILLDDPTPRGSLKTMEATYVILPDACGPALKVIVDTILDGGAPVAFHCSNGRDRTGTIAMVILSLLGVSREDIIADYTASNARINLGHAVDLSRTVFIKEYGVEFDDDTLRTMNQALAPNVDIAFATIAKTHGSIPAYCEAFGIDAKRQDALRKKMLEPEAT